ncbi:MAG: hypothetical protein LBT47_00285 [Deltaproteobacteria bacterium]|jgi:hypothetical protein|nr:hypothetical protein [Deltaproteobacteria bacterium]
MPSTNFDRTQKIILSATTLIGVVFLGFMFKFFHHGFEFTDEGVILSVMERPREYPTFHLLTGFLFNPLYRLLDGDIALLRSFNFLIFFLLATNLSRLVLLKTKPAQTELKGPWLVTASMALAFGSLTIFLLWHPTPNYNLLNYMALMITASGLVELSDTKNDNNNKSAPVSWGAWATIGLGGYLAFMAKPFTAGGLLFLVIVWAVWSGHFKPKGLLLAAVVAFGLLFISAIWIDSSPTAFIQRFLASVREEKLSGAHSVFTLVTFFWPFLWQNLSWELMVGFLVLFLLGFSLGFTEKVKNIFKIFPVLFLAAVTFYFFVRYYPLLMWFNYLAGYLVWAPVLGTVTWVIKNRSASSVINRPLLVILSLFSVAYGLGSNNSFFLTVSLASFFILLALTGLVGSLSNPGNYHFRVTALVSITVLLSAGVVITAWGHPYRQPPKLWSYSVMAPVRNGGRPLFFTPMVGRYLLTLHQLAASSGLAAGTPMVDLTGRAPGVLYAVQGYTPGAFWLNSLNPGANQYAHYMLAKIPCSQLVSSWVLWEKIPPIRPLDPAVLAPSGINFPDDFESVGSVRYTSEYGHGSPYSRLQYLLKPIKQFEPAVQACLASRAAH